MVEALLAGVLARAELSGAWHPTGFVVVPLRDDGRGALRLHVWPVGRRLLGRPCWPIHDHTWQLTSRVLCGSIEHERFVLTDDPQGQPLYAVDYGPGRDSTLIRGERRGRVTSAGRHRVRAGQRYRVAAGEFHTTHGPPPTELAATLVATNRGGRTSPWVVGQAEAPPRIPVRRALVEPGRLRLAVQAVYGALAIDDAAK